MHIDVDEPSHLRAELDRLRRRFSATLESLFDPHVVLGAVRDEDGQLVDLMHLEANETACRYHGLARDELVGRTLSEIAPRNSGQHLFEMCPRVIETGEPFELAGHPFPDPRHGGEVRWFDVRTVKVDDAVSHSWRDVTEDHLMQDRLSHLAMHDPLTGLANRSGLHDELSRALAAGRRRGWATGVILLDLDGFKQVNDALGHDVGDQLLQAAADRLVSLIRAGDLVARLGGDEFVVVMRELRSPDEATHAARRVVEAFRSPLTVGERQLRTTTSVGVAVSEDSATAADLVRDADTAMYQSKDLGRDRLTVFGEALRRSTTARSALEEDLREALPNQRLAVHYLPVVDQADGTIVAVEALLRWSHPSGDLLAAGSFIGLAERNGLILEIGNWAVEEACRAAVEWHRRHPHRSLKFSVNAARAQLMDPTMVGIVETAVADGLDPRSLYLELDEPSLANASATMRSALAHLVESGVRITLDGFGTGRSALACLRDHHIDAVKLDVSWVRQVSVDHRVRRLLAGLCALAQQMDLELFADGVESMEQARILQSLGCQMLQGYLYSPPVPSERLDALVERRYAVD